mgnify:CR=1 FL=1
MENNWYIYRHLKPNGEVFYIGIGKIKDFKRAYEKYNRNNHWKNKVKKYPDYEVQILKTGLTKEEACELETILISWYGRADCCGGTLVNLTDGGEGVENLIQSEDSKKRRADKISVKYKGEGNPFYGKKHSKETKKYIGQIQKQYFTYSDGSWDNVTIKKYNDSIRNKKSKKVINERTKEIFNSLREASEYYNVSYTTMKNRMTGERADRNELKYIIEILENNSK